MDDFTTNTPPEDQTGFAPPQPDASTQNNAAAPQQPETSNPFQQVPPAPETSSIPPQSTATGSFQQTPPPFQQPDFNNFDIQNGQITGAQPKKKRKGWKVAVISVVSAVVVLGAASGVAYAASDTVKNFVKMNMGSEDNYYEWVVEKNTKDWGRSVSESYEKSIARSRKEPQSDLSMNITLSQEAQDLLEQELFADSNETIQLSSATIACSGKVEAEKLGGKLTITLNDTQVLEGNAVMDASNLYVQIPSISDQYLSMSLEDAISTAEADANVSIGTSFDVSSFFVTPDVLEERLSPSDLNDLFQRYGEVLADSDAKIAILKDQNLSIDDTNFSYTALEATYAGNHLQNIAEDLLEELKEDKTISHYLAESGLMTEDEYKNTLQRTLYEIRNDPATEEEDGITITFYVDPTGTIRGCSMADADNPDDKVLDCYVGKEGDQIGIYCNMDDELVVNGTLVEGSKDTYSGTVTATADGEEIKLDFTDFKVVEEEHGYCSGSIAVTIPDVADTFTIHLDSNGNSQTISADIAVEGTNYATVSCTIGTSEGDDMALTIPESALDMTNDSDMETYVGDGTQIESFLKNVGTALGISDVDGFVEAFTSGYNGTEEDPDGYDTDPLPGDTDDTNTDPVIDDTINEEEFEADLSAASITYNGGKLFRFYDNNKDLIGLVDSTMNPTIEAEDYNWYYNADATIEIGLENKTTQTANAADCGIFEIQIYQGAPTDIKIGIVGIGSSLADLEKQFGIDIADGAETSPTHIVSIYDTTTNGQTAYSFYLENGVVTALDLVSYA